jgi:hypothetical protein
MTFSLSTNNASSIPFIAQPDYVVDTKFAVKYKMVALLLVSPVNTINLKELPP